MENACFYDYKYKKLNIVIIKIFFYTVSPNYFVYVNYLKMIKRMFKKSKIKILYPPHKQFMLRKYYAELYSNFVITLLICTVVTRCLILKPTSQFFYLLSIIF